MGAIRTFFMTQCLAAFVLIACLVLLPSAAFAQQLVSHEVTPPHESITELARSGRAYVQNQMGIESALVLGRGHTIGDARRWFEKAARQDYAPAQVNLALLYLNGWGVRRDYDEAWRAFRAAAEHGDTGAMVDLGFMSDSGLGTTRDQSAAVNWYRQAAENGDPLGQNNLADMYLRGEGVPQDYALAFDWFQKAAVQGQTSARIKLGFLYMTGRGTVKDLEAAYAWIQSASLMGDQRGQEYLSQLEKQLTPEQIARAEQRAAALRDDTQRNTKELAFLR